MHISMIALNVIVLQENQDALWGTIVHSHLIGLHRIRKGFY